MNTQRLQIENGLPRDTSSGEIATALAEVKRLRQDADEKAAELDRAIERLRILVEGDPPAAEERRSVPLHQSLRPVGGPADHTPREAMLRATQMAVAGSARDEIEATLRDEFEVTDASRVVEQILGPPGAPRSKGSASDSPPPRSPVALDRD